MRLRALIPRLPRALWAIEAGSLLTYFGSGLILPFEIIYFHNVRGFSLELAGVIAGTYPAFALLGAVFGGPLVDRLGARWCMAGALVAGATGTAALAFVTAPWHALAVNAFLGIVGGIFLPGRSALLAALAGPEQRHAAYGLQFAAANLGIAAGAGAGGLIAHSSSLTAYQTLFLVDAAVTASFGLLVLLVTRTGVRAAPADGEEEAEVERPGRYRDLLQHRPLVGFIGITALIGLGGLALFEAGLPVFARNHEGLDERGIGFLFFVNSFVIVLAQFPVMRLIEGRRRLRAIALALGLWTCAWLFVAVGAPLTSGSGDIALFVAVVALFAVGECLIAPIQGALVVDLAPERLRGRCLAAHSSAYAVGMTIGPPLVAIVLSREPPLLWFAGAGVLAFAAMLALALDRRLPAAVRRTPFAERFGSGGAAVEGAVLES